MRIAALAVPIVFAATVHADPVPIVNAGFESPAMGAGGFTIAVPPGWTSMSFEGGVFQTTGWIPPPYTPEGNQIGYLNGGYFEQLLEASLQQDTRYTFRFFACNRPNYSGGVKLSLYAGQELFIVIDSRQSTIPLGTCVELTAEAFAGSATPGLGERLRVRVEKAGGNQANFDHIRLETTLSICIADLNGDGAIDFNDYLEFLVRFNNNDIRADFNGDGAIDFNDYLEFLNLYNLGC